MITYVRHRHGEAFQHRKFGPYPNEPALREYDECPVCREPFDTGDYTTLVPIGADSPEEQAKATAGRWFNALAVEVHWACSGAPEPKEDTHG